MLLDIAQTLCDRNYVSNDQIGTMDSGLHFLIYPANSSTFTVYDGTNVRCQTNGAVKTITLNSIDRAIRLQIFSKEPNDIKRDGVTLNRLTTRPAFDAANAGWWQDTANGFTFIKFPHAGGETVLAF